MSNLQPEIKAHPQARIGQLSIGNKSVETPSVFTTLVRKTDVDIILEAFQYNLREGISNPYNNTGGFVVEAQEAADILEEPSEQYSREEVQQTFQGTKALVNFYDLLDDYHRVLFIDPNTDRMLYYAYRDKFQAISELPPEIRAVLENYPVDGEQTQFDALREIRINSSVEFKFCESILDLEMNYDVDALIAPYYPIDNNSIGREEECDTWGPSKRDNRGIDSIPQNIRLFKISRDIAKREYNKPVYPVIPLKNEIFTAEPENTENGSSPPQIWLDILNDYRKLDTDLLFLKATNMKIEPETLEKDKIEGVVNFIKFFRKNLSDTPLFFLGMDRLAYVLMANGLDIYSHPIYDSPFDKGPGGSSNNNGDREYDDINRNCKYFVPRTGELVKFDQLDDLGCHCSFCEAFAQEDPADIPIHIQIDLRRKHWVEVKDDYIRQLKDAIRADQVRPALKNMFIDSEWEKNYIKFL